MLQNQIKKLRLELGISQNELAKRAGYSHEFISQVERGVKTPSLKTLKKIAFGLNVCPSFLITTNQISKETEDSLTKEIKLNLSNLSIDELKVLRDLVLCLSKSKVSPIPDEII
ncbi:MAG: helix-turn-helix transcriptional regulator [Peptococcaceae bacterium]|nr:helix-turn-helix transcriptional regulator [Peptococcaceae bacterium]